MKCAPANVDELCQQLRDAQASGERLESFDLSALTQVQQYCPEDLTITVQTGMTLAALQSILKSQWLAIDPPRPSATTLEQILHRNLSGPRRFGFGTIREHLLGVSAILANGQLIHNGGRVVKNVAGYDLCKLFVGSQATLGIVVEATFKLLPLPEREVFLAWSAPNLTEAMQRVEKILAMPITPVALDLHNLNGLQLVVALAGTEEDVAAQRAQLPDFQLIPDLSYDEILDPNRVQWHSVQPSRLQEHLSALGGVPFVARAGNGIIYAEGGPAPAMKARPVELEQRVKNIFDPKGVLPLLAW